MLEVLANGLFRLSQESPVLEKVSPDFLLSQEVGLDYLSEAGLTGNAI